MSEQKGNVGLIHGHCAEERDRKFQEENPNLKLETGNCVKLPFPIEPDNPETNYEYMWLVVGQADNENKQGIGGLISLPMFAPLYVGDVFEFEYKEVCEFAEKMED